MPKPRPVHVTHIRDADCVPIVVIPLASGGNAKMLYEDWCAWNARGLPTRWTANPNGSGQAYVRAARTMATGRLITVPRVLMDAGRGEIVEYVDGDRANLRRDNLRLTSGAAKRRDAAIPGAPPRPPSKATLARRERARAAIMAAIVAHKASVTASGAPPAE
jgi:hypothetical protein